MNLTEAKQAANNAGNGSESDLRNVLLAILDGTVQIADGDFVTLTLGGTQVTATAAELNKLDGAGAVVASGTQAAVIADPSGGATTDAEARTAINALIDACQAFGIVATS